MNQFCCSADERGCVIFQEHSSFYIWSKMTWTLFHSLEPAHDPLNDFFKKSMHSFSRSSCQTTNTTKDLFKRFLIVSRRWIISGHWFKTMWRGPESCYNHVNRPWEVLWLCKQTLRGAIGLIQALRGAIIM